MMNKTWTIKGFAAEQFATAEQVAVAVRRMVRVEAGQAVEVRPVSEGWHVAIVEQDFGQQAWVNIADELSGDPRFLADAADPWYVEEAQRFAAAHGLPWPPPGDVDHALRMVEERGIERADR